MTKNGETVHTRYNGWPRMAAIFRSMPEEKIKTIAEPGLGFVLGGLLMNLDHPLGSLILVSAFALFFVQGTIESVERARALEMNDALIEQQQMAERFRAMQRDRR